MLARPSDEPLPFDSNRTHGRTLEMARSHVASMLRRINDERTKQELRLLLERFRETLERAPRRSVHTALLEFRMAATALVKQLEQRRRKP